MLYRDLFFASVTEMCPKVSEKPKRAHKGVMLRVKLDIIKCFLYVLGFLGGLGMLKKNFT